MIKFESIRKIATGQGVDYKTGRLLGYSYFKQNYKMTATDLSKHQRLDADYRAIQLLNLTTNLDRNDNRRTFFILEEVKKKLF